MPAMTDFLSSLFPASPGGPGAQPAMPPAQGGAGVMGLPGGPSGPAQAKPNDNLMALIAKFLGSSTPGLASPAAAAPAPKPAGNGGAMLPPVTPQSPIIKAMMGDFGAKPAAPMALPPAPMPSPAAPKPLPVTEAMAQPPEILPWAKGGVNEAAPVINTDADGSKFLGMGGDEWKQTLGDVLKGAASVDPRRGAWGAAVQGAGGYASAEDASEAARTKAALTAEDRKIDAETREFDQKFKSNQDRRAESAEARSVTAERRAERLGKMNEVKVASEIRRMINPSVTPQQRTSIYNGAQANYNRAVQGGASPEEAMAQVRQLLETGENYVASGQLPGSAPVAPGAPAAPGAAAPGGPREGATATNPSTGEKMVYRGGKWQAN